MKFEDRPEVKQYYSNQKCLRMARIFMDRASESGIPEIYQRINKETFKSFLFSEYHTGDGIDKVTDLIYDTPDKLCKIPFILIDGGDSIARKKAGYAILFRMILFNKIARAVFCKDMVSKLDTFSAVNDEMLVRVDLAAELKGFDILFIEEFYPEIFHINRDGGSLTDSIIDDRLRNVRPTVVSFVNAISPIKEAICGRYLADMLNKEYPNSRDHSINPSGDYLRIRVKS